MAAFLADAGHHLLLALDGSLVVGMASALEQRHIDRASQLLVTELAVTPSRQREGIGQALVQALLAIASERGCARMAVVTESDNRAALALYGSSGAAADEASSRTLCWQTAPTVSPRHSPHN